VARIQTVFQYERDGNTLVVSPRRDCLDVQESDLRFEIEELHKLLDDPGVKNLVVDTGTAPHFGSLIIGAIMALCKKVHDGGGRAAFCNASPGMLDAMQIMKIDSVMPYFPTRAEALASLK
jgi:anti-anti-sigma factor